MQPRHEATLTQPLHYNAICNTELQNTIQLRATASEIATPKPDLDRKAKKRRFWSIFYKDLRKTTSAKIEKICWQISVAASATPIRFTMSSCHRFKKRIELRTQEPPLVAEHRGGTKTTAAATAAHTMYLSSPAAATKHGKTQGFVLRPRPQNKAHATFMQPLQCGSQHSLHHQFPSSPPFVTTLRHHFPSSPPPLVTTSQSHHTPFVTTSLSHHTPFVTTSLHHHFPLSPLPFVTTSLSHHFPKSPHSPRHRFPSHHTPFVTTSLPHHFPKSPFP